MWFYFSIPALFIVLGIVLWVFARPSKPQEFGRLMVLAGLIALALGLGQHYFPIGR